MNEQKTTIKTVAAVIEGDANVALGERAQKAIWSEQVLELALVDARIRATFDELALPFLDGEDQRGRLEALDEELQKASRIANVLWWLAPADVVDADDSGDAA